MKRSLWLLGLILAGCHFSYDTTFTEDRYALEGDTEIRSYQKVYPLQENYNPYEMDAMIDDPSEASCEFMTFSAFWEYYHDQKIDASLQIQKVLDEPTCSLCHNAGLWLKALSYENQKLWNKGLLALQPLFESKSDRFFIPALGLSYRLQTTRKTSVNNLSPKEQDIIQVQKDLLSLYQQTPSEPLIPYHLVILVQESPSSDFFKNMIQSFEGQNAIASVTVLSIKSSKKDILKALEMPQTVLIGYYLDHPIPKEYLLESMASITVGEAFVKSRSTDYWLMDPSLSMIQSLRFDPVYLQPQLVLYEEDCVSTLALKVLQRYAKTVKIKPAQLETTLNQLMRLPDRKDIFQKIFSDNKIDYIALPNPLPQSILALVKSETLIGLTNHLNQHGQQKTLILSDPRALTGIPEKDSPFAGVLFYTHPFNQEPLPYQHDQIGSDLIELTQRLSSFQNDKFYIYHGKLGAYSLYNQQIRTYRWWARYKDRSFNKEGLTIEAPLTSDKKEAPCSNLC